MRVILNQSATQELIRTIERGGFTIVYRLLESVNPMERRSVFSVTISIQKGNYHDERTAFDIARNRRAALRILDILQRNTVTPCALFDVLEDIL